VGSPSFYRQADLLMRRSTCRVCSSALDLATYNPGKDAVSCTGLAGVGVHINQLASLRARAAGRTERRTP